MKTWLLIALLVLVAVLVAQNSGVVTLKFLFWETSMSRVVLLLLTLAFGMAIGFIAAKLPRGGRRDEPN